MLVAAVRPCCAGGSTSSGAHALLAVRLRSWRASLGRPSRGRVALPIARARVCSVTLGQAQAYQIGQMGCIELEFLGRARRQPTNTTSLGPKLAAVRCPYVRNRIAAYWLGIHDVANGNGNDGHRPPSPSPSLASSHGVARARYGARRRSTHAPHSRGRVRRHQMPRVVGDADRPPPPRPDRPRLPPPVAASRQLRRGRRFSPFLSMASKFPPALIRVLWLVFGVGGGEAVAEERGRGAGHRRADLRVHACGRGALLAGHVVA